MNQNDNNMNVSSWVLVKDMRSSGSENMYKVNRLRIYKLTDSKLFAKKLHKTKENCLQTCKTTESRSFANIPPITRKVMLGSSKVSPGGISINNMQYINIYQKYQRRVQHQRQNRMNKSNNICNEL